MPQTPVNHPTFPATGRFLFGMLLGLAALVGPSCAPESPRLVPLPSPVVATDSGAQTTVTAKPRDAGYAVRRALPAFDLAVLSESGSPPEGFFTFEIVALRGDPGLVRFDFGPTGASLAAARAARSMTITVRLGRLGDPSREKALAARIAREALTLAETE